MTPEFWNNKRIFITGHTGFKGSWLSLLLHLFNTKIWGYSLPPKTQSLFKAANIESYLETSYLYDIRDINRLKQIVALVKPDFIFHLAAQPLVRYSYAHPVETYETNVLGTVNILEALRDSTTAKVLINVTTDKCYENRNASTAFQETDNLGGYDPYSSSKACSELVTSAYRSSYFNPENFEHHGKAIATARAGNVIGGGDWAEDRLIPDLISAFNSGKKPLIRYPASIRPWQHVLDPLAGYLTLAEILWHEPTKFAESWNFGPRDTDCKSVEWIANKLNQLWGKNLGWETLPGDHAHEMQYLKLNISKAQTRLQWQPQWDLMTTLEATVAWYQHWFIEGEALNFTLNQIKSYIYQLENINA